MGKDKKKKKGKAFAHRKKKDGKKRKRSDVVYDLAVESKVKKVARYLALVRRRILFVNPSSSLLEG